MKTAAAQMCSTIALQIKHDQAYAQPENTSPPTYPCKRSPVIGALPGSAREYPYESMSKLLPLTPTVISIISVEYHSLYIKGKFVVTIRPLSWRDQLSIFFISCE